MVWGHASIRDPGGRGAWMKSAGWGLEEIDAGKIVLVSPDGAVLDSGVAEGGGPRHIEYPIHTQIMAARPDVGSVVHTHSSAANEFAALDVPLRPLDHAGSLFCYPDIPRFTLTGGLIKTRELGAALAGALGDARACLMPQHGIVTVGPDAPAAVMTAVLLDRACRTQLTAMAAGPLRRWGDEEDTVAKRADVWSGRQLRAGWEYLLRRSAQVEPPEQVDQHELVHQVERERDLTGIDQRPGHQPAPSAGQVRLRGEHDSGEEERRQHGGDPFHRRRVDVACQLAVQVIDAGIDDDLFEVG